MKRTLFLIAICALLISVKAFGLDIEVQTTTPTTTPSTPGGDGALLFAKRVALVTGGRIQMTILEPNTKVQSDAILESVSKGSDQGGIDAAIVVPTQNKVRFRGGFVALPFTDLYLSGVPFGPEAEEFLSWLYEGGGLQLENDLYNTRLSGGDGVVAMPMGIYHGDGSGLTPTRIPDSTRKLANTPWHLRILGLGGQVIQKAISKFPGNHKLEINPGTVNIPVYNDLLNGTLQATEFGSPARDLYEFFDKPSAVGNHPASHLTNSGNPSVVSLKFYYLGAWHQPFDLFEFVINRSIYESLGKKLQGRLQEAARANITAEFSRTDKASGDAVHQLRTQYGVTIVKSWPVEVLHDLRAATIEVLNERAAADSDFNTVLNSLREFTKTQQLYWKNNNVDPTKRFDTSDDATWPGWESSKD